MTSTELAVRDTAAAIPAKIQYAKALAESGLLPASYRKQPANILYAVEYGEMLELPPMAAITGIHLIDGRPAISAGLISALVRRAGHRLRVIGDERQAQAQLVRSDDPNFTYKATWTIERARQAGLLNKQNWRQYPAAMLKARAISEVARDACQEVLLGVSYTPEELGAQGITDGEADDMGLMTTSQRVEHAELRRMNEPPAGAVEKLDHTPGDDPWYEDPAAQAQEAPPPAGPPAPPATTQARKPGLDKLAALFEQFGLDDTEQETVIHWLAPGEWTASAAQVRDVAKHLQAFLTDAGGDVAAARSELWDAYQRLQEAAP